MKPEIRCGQHISNWNYYKIGELCELLTGFPFPGCQIVKTGKNLLMRGINITEGYIRHSEDIDRYYDGHTTNLEKYRLKTGDLVIGMDGSKVGKNSALITSKENNSLLVQRVARLRNKDRNLIRLIQITVSSSKFLKYIEEMKTSSAIPHISPTDIKDFTISLPTDLNERNLLASYFQSLDSLIQTTSKELASLKQIKAASLQSMFPQEGETVPKVRFKGFEGKWKNLTLGEIGKWSKGRLLSKSDLTADGKNPCIHYGELFVNYSEVINEVESYTNVDNGCYSEIGDILFPDSDVTATGLARCSAIMQNGVILGGGINILKVDKKFYSPYISYSINQEKGQIISRVIGTTVRHINSTALSEVQIAVPSDIKEQQQIANYFTCLDKQITLQAQRLEKLKQIKAACLDKMFV